MQQVPASMVAADVATQAELDAAIAAEVAARNAAISAAVSAIPTVLTKSYTSPQQTITSAGQLVLAHGMAIKPKIVQLTLVCLTAELNYSIGDEIVVTVNQTGTAADRHTSVKIDATNITIRYSSTGAVFYVANATTGAAAGLTNANWAMVVRAFA